MSRRLLHLDAFSGAAGNMFMGAMLDLGLSRKRLLEGLAPLGLDFKLVVRRVTRHGLAGRHVDGKQGDVVLGNFHLLQAGTRLLAAQGGGAIVVLLTAAILRTATCDGMSSIPKAAVASMVRQLARDAGRLDVRCNGVAPGAMRTSKVMDVAALDPYERHLVQEFVADTPSGRLNDPETVAELIAFLLSERAASISGQIIAADGGYSA